MQDLGQNRRDAITAYSEKNTKANLELFITAHFMQLADNLAQLHRQQEAVAEELEGARKELDAVYVRQQEQQQESKDFKAHMDRLNMAVRQQYGKPRTDEELIRSANLGTESIQLKATNAILAREMSVTANRRRTLEALIPELESEVARLEAQIRSLP